MTRSKNTNCYKCNREFTDENIEIHQYIINAGVESYAPLGICKECFLKERNEKEMSNKKIYGKCDKCGEVFTNKHNAKFHGLDQLHWCPATVEVLDISVKNLKFWQEEITKVCIEKGFDWKPEDIDMMLFRTLGELVEASEAVRDNNFEGLAEELADTFIRLVNTAEVMGIDLEKEVIKKHEKNKSRPKLHGRVNK